MTGVKKLTPAQAEMVYSILTGLANDFYFAADSEAEHDAILDRAYKEVEKISINPSEWGEKRR